MEKKKLEAKPEIKPAAIEVDRPYWELFPADQHAGEDDWSPVDPTSTSVRLYRLEANGDQRSLGKYLASELPDDFVLQRLHGGGSYLAVACWSKGKQNGQVVRRRVIKLEGEPLRPFVPAMPATPPSVGPPSAIPVASPGKTTLELVLAFATVVVPCLFGYWQTTAAAAHAAQGEQAKALAEQQKAQYDALIAAFKSVQGPAAAAAPAPPMPASPVATVKELIELMSALGYKKQEADIMEELLKAAPLVAMFMGNRGAAFPGVVHVPPAPGPPPTLAS